MLGGDMAVRFRAGEVKNLGSDLQKVVNGTCRIYKSAQKFAKNIKQNKCEQKEYFTYIKMILFDFQQQKMHCCCD